MVNQRWFLNLELNRNVAAGMKMISLGGFFHIFPFSVYIFTVFPTFRLDPHQTATRKKAAPQW